MGYRKIPTIHTLEFDGALEGLVIRVKSIPFGKVRKMMALLDDDKKDGVVMDEITGRVADAIASWNLQDEYGRDIAVSREAIDDLEFEDVMQLVDKWLECITGPNKELGKDSSSSATSPVPPLTMEVL